jgi:hypothetical protein
MAAFEADVVKDSLVTAGPASCVSRIEEHCSNAGGGNDASSLINGTSKNGDGGDATIDDGKTFRGYGDGDSLTFYLDTAKHKAGYDITKILTFAGHGDTRASQNYTVSVAMAAAPGEFKLLVPAASASCDGGSSEIVIANKAGGPLDNGKGVSAARVVAIRFDFKNGSLEDGVGLGFDVYREICVVGAPAG